MVSGQASEQIDGLSTLARECGRCGLAQTRTNVVFGEGNPDTPLVFVGEGPGQTEDETGRPFVGRSGALLDECLRENKITRKHVYICNVVRCRACNIDERTGRISNRPPTPAETAACSPWLAQTLEIIKPIVIFCLGGPSANAIIHPEFRITRQRGQWFTSKYAPHAIASWHPSYILRQDAAAYDKVRLELVEDIALARRKVIEIRKSAENSDR